MGAVSAGLTLQEAIETGRGIERPFRCEVHEDSQASASVNIVKGVWFCHACHASGRVGDKKAPAPDDLAAMLAPEKAIRRYALAWLELFQIRRPDASAYWLERFTPEMVWYHQLGQDPFTGDATFPVYTPYGQLAGVGRRRVEEVENEDGTLRKRSRYLYPKGWSASMSLGGLPGGRVEPMPVVCIVEGMADATAVWETGCPAVAQWGSQLHQPQVEQLARLNPKLILLGQDMDEAGERGVSLAFKQLRRVAPLVRVHWARKDPAESHAEARMSALLRAVRRSDYGVDVLPQWSQTLVQIEQAYDREVKEGR